VSRQTFAEQAIRYFDRPHEGVPASPVGGPAAWRGEALAERDDWIVRLGAAAVDEIERAAAATAGRPLADVDRSAFPLPTLGRAIAGWARELATGRGFLLLRGLPAARWSEEEASRVFWGLGQHLGTPGGQNRDEDLLGHVLDTGEEAASPFVRRYRTRGDIAYHCDLADVVGLMCLATPRSGGASRIASSVTVHDEVLRRRPDLLPRLYEPFALDTRDEAGASGRTHLPVPPCRFAGGRLRTFYHSDYFRSAPRHADVAPFTDAERTLLDLYEEIASTPGVYLDMQFEVGDIQLVSNHTVVHARTAYEDWPAHRRHLLRLWLSLRDDVAPFRPSSAGAGPSPPRG
jgi:hypothetical protein